MDAVILVLLPILFLLAAASMLVASQLSGYFQFNRYSRRNSENRRQLQEFMAKLAVAQSQVSQRSRQLESLSARLQLNNQELARLNGMKSKFLSMAVHDMRTPLASIKGFGEMLSRQTLGPGQQKYLDYIIRGTEQINRLMGDLTDLAVIEAGKLKMEKQPFELFDMVDGLAQQINLLATKKGVDFSWVEPPRGIIVVGDRFRLAQALQNFLGNAVKFTPAGGKVELKVAWTPKTALLQCKDSGPGIHASERKRVFEKFYQSQFSDQASRKQGWGLGLAIAQEIVMAHQGEIGVDSPGLGKGATFWYKIPLKPPAQSRLALPAGGGKALAKVAAILLALFLAAPVRAQSGIPVEEKTRFESAIQQKIETVLLHMLGPSRYRVVVNADLDFTRIERFDVKTGAAGSAEDKGALFLWQSIGAKSEQNELLPGIPSPEPLFGGARSFERQSTFPTSFVKRLDVSVIVDDQVTEAQRATIERIIPDILSLNPDRDVFSIVRAPFAPAWKTIWYTPEAMSLMFKYGLISLMTLVTLVVVAACFLKLADAMNSMADAQAHQLQMDFGQPGGPEAAKEGEGEGEKKEGEAAEAGGAAKLVFNVHADQLDTLTEMLKGQPAENVALIAAHLPPDVKKLFLGRLPAGVYSEVLLNLGSVKFVDQEMVATVKEELERRLDSAVGGRNQILDLLETSTLETKKELLRLLELRDPELAALVRAKVMLFDDLLHLEEKDWPTVIAAVPIETWAVGLFGVDQDFQDVVKHQMLPKTARILDQTMAIGKPSDAAVQKAQGLVVDAVTKLAAEGRITNPVTHRIEFFSGPKKEEAPSPFVETQVDLG